MGIKKKHILLLGAGLSSSVLIQYLLNESRRRDWRLTIGDQVTSQVSAEIQRDPRAEVLKIDIRHENALVDIIRLSDLVISMVPASFHDIIAKVCLDCGRSMLTASYVTPAMREMDSLFREKGLVLLGEIGLDPGIDHMSAMKVIDQIRQE